MWRNACRGLVGNLKSRENMENLNTDWSKILEESQRYRIVEIGLIYLAEDKKKWRALVNMIMNLRIS
jgi:hypothetical protein